MGQLLMQFNSDIAVNEAKITDSLIEEREERIEYEAEYGND